ncbi:phage regulatory CII family protein [Sinorhizobium fredii]|uniref:phage regulatory CII family protein n=1 Tax=Rhizobium fredii TaxID=380 RepID=UPI0004B895B6|nr:phage regulatory CII family protein [Sinorhizobium fredii]
MSDAFIYRVKAAQRDLIERCGGIERAVTITGFSKSQVGRWNNPNDPDLIPIGAARALEQDCRQPLITAVMAEANGRRLTDPEAERQADVNVLTAHAEVMRLSGELANAVAAAISDGQFTPTEATAVDRVASSLERAMSDLRAMAAVVKSRGGVTAGLRLVTE